MALASERCVPCGGGAEPMTRAETEARMAEIPGWTLEDGGTRIERTFRFEDFAGALDFVREVGAAAEAEQHHPDIELGWGRCTVSFRTHRIRGLHRNDFVMAAKVNAIAGG
jgi:4a-hydroxytetrahydrobiopterin dehydratase